MCGEAANIRRQHVHLYDNFFTLDLPQSKTDPLGQGEHIYIVKTVNKLCPLTWIVWYLVTAEVADDSHMLIFRAVFVFVLYDLLEYNLHIVW